MYCIVCSRWVNFRDASLLGRILSGSAGWQRASPERRHFHLSISWDGLPGESQAGRARRHREAISIFLSPWADSVGRASWQRASPERRHFHLSFSLDGLPGEPQAGRARHHREAISIFRSFPTYAMPVQARLGQKTLLKFFRRPHCQRDACTLHPQHPAGTHPVTPYIVL